MNEKPPDSELSLVSTPLLGTVLAVQANFYQVQVDLGIESISSDEHSKTPKSRALLKLGGNLPAGLRPATLTPPKIVRLSAVRLSSPS
ncbi:MAG: hypothetical protein LDL41_17125, partial [Coleofasciculus sp. S288]|nr:hypothetical protein [Coleofasciculus sp. S288]